MNLKQTIMKLTGFSLSAFFAVLFLVSCSTSKEARTFRSSINGKWQLQTVTTEGITGKVKAQILNEADLNCFIGSNWSFNQNNSLGSYTISQNAGECVAVTRNIRWSIYEAKDEPKLFQFKKLDDKLKPIEEGNAGYRFTILKLDNNAMQLRNDINFEGKPASLIYNFVRN
jgi:hypothetical protein